MKVAYCCAHYANRSFDIVYINLERSAAKREHVERMLRHAGCLFRRFNAVDGRELCERRRSVQDYTNGTKIAFTDDMIQERISTKNMGKIGCHLSHLIVLRMIDASNTERPVLVLEDDVDLNKFFVRKVENAIAHPPGRWSVLLLGSVFREKWWKRRSSRQFVEVYFEGCLHAYLVSGARNARRIADEIEACNYPEIDVDIVIDKAFMNDDSFVFYSFTPVIAVQRNDLFDSNTRAPRKTFYRKYISVHFKPLIGRPMWNNSLAEASLPTSGGEKSSSAPLLPLFAILLLSSHTLIDAVL